MCEIAINPPPLSRYRTTRTRVRARTILDLYFIYRAVADFYSVVDDFPLLGCYRNLRSVGLASCRWCWQAWVTHGFDFGELVIPLG